MKPVYFKYLTFGIGAASVLVSILLGNEHTQFIKPFFHVSLFLFFYTTTKKINYPLILFLTCGMLGEFFTARSFESNYLLINILFSIYFSLGVYCMWPVFKGAQLKIRGKDVVIAIIATTLLLYIIYGLVYYSIQEFKENVPAIVGGTAFVIFVGSCFYITLFHPHPYRINLFIVGLCYFVVCSCYIVHELLLPSRLLMGLINSTEIIAQFFFVLFLINRKSMQLKTNWYI